MTCYLAIMICIKYSIDVYTHEVTVTNKVKKAIGTSAELRKGDILTVYQLLLGLMLPSGNDAAIAVACAMGQIIHQNKKK